MYKEDKMQKFGLVFVSNVRAEDVGIFGYLSDLTNIQRNILAVQTPSEVDSTNIEIYSNGRDSDDDGDFIGGSFLSIVSLDTDSPQASEITEIFDVISSKSVAINEVSPNNYMIMVAPGASANDETKARIISLIQNTSTREDIILAINTVMLQIPSDNVATVSVNGVTPVASKPIPKTPVELTPPPEITEIPDDVVKVVYDKVLEQLKNDSSEINASIMEIGKNINDITSRIVEVVIREVRESLQANPITPIIQQEPEKVESNAITPPDVALESVVTNIENGEVIPETTIYDDVVTLKSLYNGGCESDEELFALVIKNKDKLSMDDKESACQFNMFEYFKNSKKEECSTRESMIRRIQVEI